jgi:hypothetical protein
MTDPSTNRVKREIKDAADTTENRLEEAEDNIKGE